MTITAGVTSQFDKLEPGRLYYVGEHGLVLEGNVSAGRAITRNRLIVDY